MEGLVSLRKNTSGLDSNSLTDFKERLDNDHLKFNDFQTLILSNQQRIEKLFEMIKGMESQVIQINTIDQTTNSRLVGDF